MSPIVEPKIGEEYVFYDDKYTFGHFLPVYLNTQDVIRGVQDAEIKNGSAVKIISCSFIVARIRLTKVCFVSYDLGRKQALVKIKHLMPRRCFIKTITNFPFSHQC